MVISAIEDVTVISGGYGVYEKPFAYESNVQNDLLEWSPHLLITVLPNKKKTMSQSS